MAIKILYADDEAYYRRLVRMFLEKEGYEVVTAENGEEAIDVISTRKDIDVVILDVMMPVVDGWEACKKIRSMSNIPILMLTALGDVTNEVYGIESGADDYISKPFSHEVLIARVKGLLRRVNNNIKAKMEDEGMVFIEAENAVTIKGNMSHLTPKEYELLEFLVMNKEIVLSREKILDKVWGFDYFGDPRTVDTHIKSLRAKLGDESARIKTLRGRGYTYRGEQ